MRNNNQIIRHIASNKSIAKHKMSRNEYRNYFMLKIILLILRILKHKSQKASFFFNNKNRLNNYIKNNQAADYIQKNNKPGRKIG